MAPTSIPVSAVRTRATFIYVATLACSPCPGSDVVIGASGDQVDQREDRDPHDIDEVPVEARDLDLDRVGGGEPTAEREDREREQPDDAQRDVPAVEPGEDEEGRPEQVLLEGQP